MKNLVQIIAIVLTLTSFISTSYANNDYDYLYPTDFLSDNDLLNKLKETDSILNKKSSDLADLLIEKNKLKGKYKEIKNICNRDKKCIKNAHFNFKFKINMIHEKIKTLPNLRNVKKEKLKNILIASIGSNILYKLKQKFQYKDRQSEINLGTDIIFNRAQGQQELSDLLEQKRMSNNIINESAVYIDFYFATKTFEKNIRLVIIGFKKVSYDDLVSYINSSSLFYNGSFSSLMKELLSSKSNHNLTASPRFELIDGKLSLFYKNDSVLY